ncbi:MAG TPA: cytochrome c biogenesis protein CcsA [Anaerohalosphaeraceae bacterium]|jgi:heme exporter protein C|nr:cytochrome c biogenesis protein CcsA [Anaerohalosphaeraceae bacterium]HRT51868.1 cytochrome c biogenesis protein CcsA [Anaerohalosphaeraceae bacterium]HRT87906.1 cytochrome c biogenesis protein CcsA [Anaerohalosphaeraceae bacterium]
MRRLFIVIAFVLFVAAMWVGLTRGAMEGPAANPDSPVRNIIYVHVPSSITALGCFVVLLVAALAVLAGGRPWWDHLAAATAEVGLVFATVLNLTGMIWSRAEWGPWWTPSPRLLSAAILWFLYVVMLILRSSLPGSPQRRARICAVFAVIAFLDVPMVIYSARFMADIHRPDFSFTSPWQHAAFFLSMVATGMLAGVLISLRTETIKLKALLEQQTSIGD